MEDRYLFRGKRIDNGEWITGSLIQADYIGTARSWISSEQDDKARLREISSNQAVWRAFEVRTDTICQCTELKDKNGKLIWENDILMCHGNPEDLVKAVFGEFNIINAETLEAVDRVIGWHYEVVPTDALSKCEPFCLPMPLTEEYVKMCEMEIVERSHHDGE